MIFTCISCAFAWETYPESSQHIMLISVFLGFWFSCYSRQCIFQG